MIKVRFGLLRVSLTAICAVVLLSGCLNGMGQQPPSPEEQGKIQDHMQRIKAQIEQLQAEMARLQVAAAEPPPVPVVEPEPVAPELPTDVSLLFTPGDEIPQTALYTYILAPGPEAPANLSGLLRDLAAAAPSHQEDHRFIVPSRSKVIVDQPLGHTYSSNLADELLQSLGIDQQDNALWLVTTTAPISKGTPSSALVIAHNLKSISPFFRDKVLNLYRTMGEKQSLDQLLWQLAQLSGSSQSPGSLKVKLTGSVMLLSWQ